MGATNIYAFFWGGLFKNYTLIEDPWSIILRYLGENICPNNKSPRTVAFIPMVSVQKRILSCDLVDFFGMSCIRKKHGLNFLLWR